MPKTLAELRSEREAAAKSMADLGAKLNAEGYTPTADDDAAWESAKSAYNGAKAAEEAEVARLARADAVRQTTEDAARLNAAGVATLRPNYSPPDATRDNPRVPARPRRHGPLRAFKGADAVDQAERAGLWAAAALYHDSRAAAECQRRGIEIERGSFDGGPSAAFLGTGDNARAAVFVPNEIEYAVQELALEYGTFRQYAEVVPMSAPTKDVPRWTGSMTAYYIAEGAAPTQSDPSWDLISLVTKALGAMTKMSRFLDEDSAVDLGDKVAKCIAEAFAYAEDQAGFNGDGTSTYGGITGLVTKLLAQSASYYTAATGNVTDLTLDLDDFNGCVAKLPNYPGLQPAWFMHKTVWANSAQRLQMAAGGVVPADIQAGAKPMLLGYPVHFVNVLDSTPTVSEIAAILGDLRLASKIGIRRGITVESGLINDDFTKQLMTILGTERFAINNHTITDPRSTSNTGPVVGLKLAAS